MPISTTTAEPHSALFAATDWSTACMSWFCRSRSMVSFTVEPFVALTSVRRPLGSTAPPPATSTVSLPFLPARTLSRDFSMPAWPLLEPGSLSVWPTYPSTLPPTDPFGYSRFMYCSGSIPAMRRELISRHSSGETSFFT